MHDLDTIKKRNTKRAKADARLAKAIKQAQENRVAQALDSWLQASTMKEEASVS